MSTIIIVFSVFLTMWIAEGAALRVPLPRGLGRNPSQPTLKQKELQDNDLLAPVESSLKNTKITPDGIVQSLNQLAKHCQYSGVMSARAGTLQDCDLLASLGYGFLDMRGTIPNDPNTTRFPIASNTKLLTSILIFQLQEQGILNIHDDIAQHLTPTDFQKWGLPNMKSFCMFVYNDPSRTCQKITFEMLLGMTSGIVGTTDQVLMEFVPMYMNIATMFGLMFPGMYLNFVPGTDYVYSNQNYMLLGYFVEKYTNMELGDAYQEFIFGPLSMWDTYFDRTNGLFAFDPTRTEEGYRYFLFDQPTNTLLYQLGTGKCQGDIDTGTIGGAGGVVSTLRDEAILYYCLFDMSYGDGVPNPHCPYNNSYPFSKFNKFNILSMASRRKIIAPYAYASSSPIVGTTYYAMGVEVSNNTGPYTSAIDAAIVVRGPVMQGPLAVDSDVVYPNYITYTGALMCVNTANFLALASRVNGSIAYMTQAFEAHRSMATSDPNALVKARANEQVSLFSFPTDMFAAYDATRIGFIIAQLINGTYY